MKISIFTDASVVESHCGYAFYIGSRAGKLQKSGKLRTKTNNTCKAEAHCLANALHILKTSTINPVTKVWVYCDNKALVDVINREGVFNTKDMKLVLDEITFLMIEICLKYGYGIRDISKVFSINHIKAHTGKKDKMSLINNWCDIECKKHARESFKQSKNKKK